MAGNIFIKDKINVKVVDEDGLPVEKAIFDGYFDNPSKYNGMGDTFKVLTNTNGESKIKGVLYGFVEGRAKKEGYYRSSFNKSVKELKNKKHPTIKVILRKKKQPHPMYVRFMDESVVPGTNEWYGFDFGVGDWVAPYGKGKENDMQVKVIDQVTTEGNYLWHKSLYLKCDKNTFDGVIKFKRKMWSEYSSPYLAPGTGYKKIAEYIFERSEHKIILDERAKITDGLIFRCRSKVDENGELKEANYGKIYGEIKYGIIRRNGPDKNKVTMSFLYYFNPTPNDRNLEYDPDKNLFHEREPTKWQP